jgi:hypothetical protein
MQWKKTCGIVGHNAEDYSALHPTILLCCIYGRLNLFNKLEILPVPSLEDTENPLSGSRENAQIACGEIRKR